MQILSAGGHQVAESAIQVVDAWDPLESSTDQGMILAAQRREIRNILKSYTGYYDLFAELRQNALDALERRQGEQQDADFDLTIWITIWPDPVFCTRRYESVSIDSNSSTFPPSSTFLSRPTAIANSAGVR